MRFATSGRLRFVDLARLSSIGLRTRKLRATLSALGIAIGVAAVVAVLGLSASSQAGLLAEIDKLGTNLLTVTNGQTVFGQAAELPVAAPGMISRIGPVTAVQATGSVTASVYRNPLIPVIQTNALSVLATTLDLPATVGTTLAAGTYLNAATATEPVAVLGASAASRLGIDRLYPGERIWAGQQWFYVVGILKPAVLAPELDAAMLVGFPAAKTYLGFDGHPSTIYLRANTDQVAAVQAVLAATADPEAPNQVNVSQPSAALVARAETKSALNGLFLGLGAVALLVGAIGVANIMVISVLGTSVRDRAAPRTWRDEGPHPHAVPFRGDRAGGDRRRGRGWCRRACDRDLREHQRLGNRRPAYCLGWRTRRRTDHRSCRRPATRIARCPHASDPSPLEHVSRCAPQTVRLLFSCGSKCASCGRLPAGRLPPWSPPPIWSHSRATAFVLVVIPGPSVLFLIGRALSLGRGPAIASVVGNGFGVYVVAVLRGLRVGQLGAAIRFRIWSPSRWSAPRTSCGSACRRSVIAAILAAALGTTADTDVALAGCAARIPGRVRQPESAHHFRRGAAAVRRSHRRATSLSKCSCSSAVAFGIALISDSIWVLAASGVRSWFATNPRRLAAVGGAGGLAMIGVGVTVATTGRHD